MRLLEGIFTHYKSSDERFKLTLVSTLLLLLVVPPQHWIVRVPITILAIYGIVFPKWRTYQLYWLVCFTFLIFECYLLWHIQDNHKYLIAYWCLAIGTTLPFDNPTKLLQKNARLLIGLCFGFAVLAKLLSPSFLDGTFFKSSLLFDNRFKPAARSVVGLGEEFVDGNSKLVSELADYKGPNKMQVSLTPNDDLNKFAWLLTIWTLLIEISIAVGFVVPMEKNIGRYRNQLLLVFIISTYAVANVIGFGWILATMGISQLRDDEYYFAPMYFFVIVLLNIYRIPWSVIANV